MTATDRRAELLAGVKANPDDDTPRLVFADWLNERSDPRGELIAVQIALAKIPYTEFRERSAQLWEREKDLHKRFAKTWLPFFKGTKPRPKYDFHRGFLRSIELRSQPRLAEIIGGALAAEPITSLKVDPFDEPDTAAAVLALPGLAQLKTLQVILYNRQDALHRIVAEAPALRGLHTLHAGHFGGDDGALHLARSTTLTQLRTLWLHYGAVSDAGAKALSTSPALQELTELNLSNNLMTDDGALALLALPKLERLSVRRNPDVTKPAIAKLKERLTLF